jgi:hypothetical protein
MVQMMELEPIYTYLLQQAPIVVFMGVVIWWLSKRYQKKDEQCEKLISGIVELTTFWQEWLKHNDFAKDNEKVLQKLDEIKILLLQKK